MDEMKTYDVESVFAAIVYQIGNQSEVKSLPQQTKIEISIEILGLLQRHLEAHETQGTKLSLHFLNSVPLVLTELLS